MALLHLPLLLLVSTEDANLSCATSLHVAGNPIPEGTRASGDKDARALEAARARC
jgi:hypothetical protein